MRPLILLGTLRCAALRPEAIVVDPSRRVVRNIKLRRPLHTQSRQLLALMLLRFGRVVEYEEIWEELWGHRPDGGPECVREIIGRSVFHVRHALAGTSLGVSTAWGRGVRVCLAEEATLRGDLASYPRAALHRPEDRA